MFMERTAKDYFLSAGAFFPAVLLTGPRQVGKTTFLRKLAGPERKYVSLDNMLDVQLARTDPRAFLARYEPPVLIDEIQYAPELLPYIKLMIDEARLAQAPSCNGMFWLTGSQQFQMMKGVTESLAGRVGIVDMLGFSQAELDGRESKPFLPDRDFAVKQSHLDLLSLYRQIWLGSFPGIARGEDAQREMFYSAYVRTYLERDVRDLGSVNDLERFFRFLRSVAARTGQLLNYADLARDADVNVATAKNWLSVLKASGLIFLLEPYSNNLTSRLVRTPKLYMLDTGLCTWLTQWPTPQILEAGAMSGAIFETWCFTEILKSYWHNGQSRPGLFFYRDKDQKEIDLVIEVGGTLYPVEFKKSASPSLDDCRHFRVLERFKKPIGMGGLVCMYPEVFQIRENCRIIPAALI